MEYKFLSDGRKVAIVGQINSTEYVVQEIFITADGDEMPSGEKFTTKSLHDKPVESYFHREEKSRKERIAMLEDRIKDADRLLTEKDQKLKAKADMLANSPELKQLVGKDADIIAKFMTGIIEYIVVDDYKLKAPQKMGDGIINWKSGYGERQYDDLKLVSILGRSGGKLSYNIHRYSDGSGGSSHEVFPFSLYEEAIDKIKELAIKKIECKYFTEEERDLCKELGIVFDKEINDKMVNIFSESLITNIASAQTFDYWKEQLEANKTPMLMTELSPTPVEGESRE